MAVEIITPPASPYWLFAEALEDGQIFATGEDPNICCPTCGPYLVASVETYLKFAEAVGNPTTSCCNCCTNVWAKSATAEEACGGVADPPPPVPAAAMAAATTTLDEGYCLGCTNRFKNEIESLKMLFSPADLQLVANVGIVEYGSLNHDLSSNISDIKDLLVAFYTAPGNLLSYKDMILHLLDKGLVIDCRPGQTFIANVETYLKYAEAVGLTQQAGGGDAAVPA